MAISQKWNDFSTIKNHHIMMTYYKISIHDVMVLWIDCYGF